jgi:uncharacterized protein YjbI with pentapeptide repeats
MARNSVNSYCAVRISQRRASAGPTLSYAALDGCSLSGADLVEANLSRANLGGTTLSDANLGGDDTTADLGSEAVTRVNFSWEFDQCASRLMCAGSFV